MDEFLEYLFDKLDREAEEHYYQTLEELGEGDEYGFDPYDPYTPAPMAA